MVSLNKLRRAVEASWEPATAYLGQAEPGNPSLGQCYPTSWLLQQYFPDLEIIEGRVVTPHGVEKHFWNLRCVGGERYHIDFTWQQFPPGSYVLIWAIRDWLNLNDGLETRHRCRLLQQKVEEYLRIGA